MRFFNKKKSGMISVEIALAVVSVIIVLFMVIGVFTDNTKTMVSSSGIKNLTQENNAKTTYSSFNRNYDSSQIEIK